MTWELRRAEQLALGGTAVAFALTAWLAGSGLAIESNPVVAAVIGRLGWVGAGVLAIGIEAGIFAVYRRLESYYPRAVRTGGWLVAAVGIGDVFVNLWLLRQVGRPETYHWHKWLPVLAVVGGVALLALWRPDPRALIGRVPDPTPAQRRVAAAVAIACLMALSGVPPSAFGPGAPAETVDIVSAAGTVLDDFEDGDKSEWSDVSDNDGSDDFFVQDSFSLEKDFTFKFNGSARELESRSITQDTYQNMSVRFRTNGTDSDNTNPKVFVASDSSAGGGINLYLDDANNLKNSDPSTDTDTGIDLAGNTNYKVIAKDIDYSNDNFDVEVQFLSNGTTHGTATDVEMGTSNNVQHIDELRAGGGSGGVTTYWDFYEAGGAESDLAGTSGGDPPYVADILPENGEYVNSSDRTVTLNASVDDPEGDPIDTTIYHNDLDGDGWRQVANQQDVSAGGWLNTTVTVDESGGENRWKVETDDDVNAASNSSVYHYYVGGSMTVFNGSDYTILNSTTVTAAIDSTNSSFETTKSDSDGKLELTGMPDEEFEAEVSASGFENQTIIIDDVTSFYAPILYESDAAATFTRCFTLDDQTGNYAPSDSTLVIKDKVNGSYEHVGSDRFGAFNNASITLSDGEDYRMEVHNDDGDVRSVGGFTADQSIDGCRTIVISSTATSDDEGDSTGGDDSDDPDEVSYTWDASFTSSDNIFWYLNLGDGTSASNVELYIWEWNNKSNKLVSPKNFGEVGTDANVTHTQILDSDQANKSWYVKWNGTVGGEDVSGSKVLGDRVQSGVTTQWPDVPGWIKLYSSIMIVLMTAASVSRADAAMGAVVVPLVAGVLWYIQWLDDAYLTGGALVLALGIAVLYKAREDEP